MRSDLIELERVTELVARLRAGALRRIAAEGYDGTPLLEPTVEMRYLGQNYSTDIAALAHGLGA